MAERKKTPEIREGLMFVNLKLKRRIKVIRKRIVRENLWRYIERKSKRRKKNIAWGKSKKKSGKRIIKIRKEATL